MVTSPQCTAYEHMKTQGSRLSAWATAARWTSDVFHPESVPFSLASPDVGQMSSLTGRFISEDLWHLTTIFITFLAVTKHLSQGDLRKEVLVWAHVQGNHPSWQGRHSGRGLKLLVTLLPPWGSKSGRLLLSSPPPFCWIWNSNHRKVSPTLGSSHVSEPNYKLSLRCAQKFLS